MSDGISRVYQFLTQYGENWKTDIDANKDDIIIKSEFSNFVLKNMKWTNEDTDAAKRDIINNFWASFDTNNKGKMDGNKKMSNSNALDAAELANMSEQIDMYNFCKWADSRNLDYDESALAAYRSYQLTEGNNPPEPTQESLDAQMTEGYNVWLRENNLDDTSENLLRFMSTYYPSAQPQDNSDTVQLLEGYSAWLRENNLDDTSENMLRFMSINNSPAPEEEAPEWQQNGFKSEEDFQDAKDRGLENLSKIYYDIVGESRDYKPKTEPIKDEDGNVVGAKVLNNDGSVDRSYLILSDGTVCRYDDEGALVSAQDADGKNVTDDIKQVFSQRDNAIKVTTFLQTGNYGTGTGFDSGKFMNDLVTKGGYQRVALDNLSNQQVYDILTGNPNASFDELLRKLENANSNAAKGATPGRTGNPTTTWNNNYGRTGGQSFGFGDQGFNDVFGNNSYSSGYHMDFWGNWVSNSFGGSGSSYYGGGGGGSHY